MTIQQIIERLLRSRLYKVGALVELDSGETSEGLVTELVYDGSRSAVVVSGHAATGPPQRLPIARITRVELRDDTDAA